MRRASVTIPPDLEDELDRFLAAQPAAPTLAAVMQQALRRYLTSAEGAGNLLLQVVRHRADIVAIAERNGATTIRLFGSVARGEETYDSDIDFVATFEPGRSLFDLARLRADLEDLLDAEVDVVSEANLDDQARRRLLAEALTL